MLIVTMYVFSCNDHDSLNYWNGGQKKHMDHAYRAGLRLSETVVSLSIICSCHIFYLFHKNWVIVLKKGK